MQETHYCDFCCTVLQEKTAYRVRATESGSQRAEPVAYAFALCRSCYDDVGHATCKLETDWLKARAQAAGVDI